MFSNIISQYLKLLKNSPEFLQTINNISWLFADRIVRMGMALLVGVWVARYLGVESYGTLNYASAFVDLFGTFSSLGLSSLVIRTIVEASTDRDTILGTTFCLQIGGGIFSIIITILASLFFDFSDPIIVPLIIILSVISLFKAFDTIEIWFQSQVQSKYTVIAKNSAFILLALIKLLLTQLKAPLIAFAWAALAEFAVSAMGLILAYQFQGFSITAWKWSVDLAKRLLREGWPLALSGLAIVIYMKIDQVMLGSMIGSEAVGLYAAATKISEIWYFIPVAIVSSVAPSIYQAKKENDELLYYNKITNLLKSLNLISLIIVLLMIFLAKPLILFLFGQDFIKSELILSIHIWAIIFVSMGVAVSPWFTAESLTNLLFYRTFSGAVANILLNLILIPTYAEVGAAIATILSYSISDFFYHAINPKTRKLFFIQFKSWTLLNNLV